MQPFDPTFFFVTFTDVCVARELVLKRQTRCRTYIKNTHDGFKDNETVNDAVRNHQTRDYKTSSLCK
jgi:hypothetical protein